MKSDGSVVCWGDASLGGTSPSKSDLDPGVAAIYSNELSFAAIRTDGTLLCWGSGSDGGDCSDVGGNFSTVYSSRYSFAALRTNGSVAMWNYDVMFHLIFVCFFKDTIPVLKGLIQIAKHQIVCFVLV